MKLCINCKWYGGISAANGKSVCNEPRNKFVHPVDGLEQKYDCFWMRFVEGLCGWEGKWWARRTSDEVRLVTAEKAVDGKLL